MEYLIYLLIAGFATILTRFLPYFFLKKATQNETLLYLQNSISIVIMVVLLIYALFGLNFSSFPLGGGAIFCLFLVFVLEIFTKNSLLSIVLPTILYIIFLKILS